MMPITKAVIPVAGYGTRLYPASKAVKKELFPLVDRDGAVKPVLHLILEEAFRSGATRVCLVVRPGDETVFRRYFTETLPASVEARIRRSGMAPHLERVLELGRRLAYVVQPEPKGFGDAVYCARAWIGGEAFLLLLGDHLARSTTTAPCARQLLDAFDRLGGSVVAVVQTPEHLLHRFGVVGGASMASGPRDYAVDAFVEKPSVAEARTRLRIEGMKKGRYLCFFGQYVLTAGIFRALDDLVSRDARERGEIQLTSALERLRRAEGVYAYEMSGERFDVGVPDGYARTVARLSGS